MVVRHALIVVALVGSSGVANAACWKLPNGSIIQTSSNSTPPVAGAKRVMCSQVTPGPIPVRRNTPTPSPSPSAIVERGIVSSDQRPDQRECVEYARSRVSSLPTGLFTFQNKRDIITPSARARVGSIAIIEVPSGASAQYGHIAYVEAVSENSITITETNFGGRRYQKRTATGRDLADAERQLRIIGYYRP